MDNIILIIDIIVVIIAFFVTFLDNNKIDKWFRFLFVLPILAINLMLFVTEWNKYLIGFYVGSFLVSFCLIINDSKKKRKIIFVCLESIIFSFVLCNLSRFYNVNDYAEEFEDVFTAMKEHYILSEEKEINWDSLYNNYYPKFVEANNNRDYVEKYKLYNQFGQEFYDGHIDLRMNLSSEEGADLKIYGNDYGLSFIKLDTGEYVAFNVEGIEKSFSIKEDNVEYSNAKDYYTENIESKRLEALNAGIHNGTVITSWDGISMDELCAIPDVFVPVFASEENRQYYLPIHAAGIGGDSVTVSFIDDNGYERFVVLDKLGYYAPRLKSSILKLNEGYDLNNLTWDNGIDENTVLLRITQMRYGDYNDDPRYYAEMKEMLCESILDYREAKKKNLILDIRANSGGSPMMVLELASIFAPEGKYLLGYTSKLNEETGSYDRGSDGKYIKDEELCCYGENLWPDGQIVILVNNYTISAGDIFTYVMSHFPNVTIMGITSSNSSAQAFNRESIDGGTISYSAIPILDKNGDILIDTLANHKGRVPIDVIIPTSREMIKAIFDDGKDYVLEYAVKYSKRDFE